MEILNMEWLSIESHNFFSNYIHSSNEIYIRYEIIKEQILKEQKPTMSYPKITLPTL